LRCAQCSISGSPSSPLLDHLPQRAIALVIGAHKADLHQPLAVLRFGVDDVSAALRGHRQRLLAEYRFASGDGRQHELFMTRPPGGDQHRLHVGGLDQIVAVVIHPRIQLQIAHHLGGVVAIDVVHRHDAGALQNFAAAADMIAADGAGADNPNVQCHFRYPLESVLCSKTNQ
jgi:hypothetical protein